MIAQRARRIRVGFILDRTDSGWTGGLNYLANLLSSLASLPDRRIDVVLFVKPDAGDEIAADFPSDIVVRSRMIVPRGWRRMAGMVTQRFLGRNLCLEWIARRHRIDVFSHVPPFGSRSPLKVISWIPDFQHIRLPDFFSHTERSLRDRNHRRMVDEASTIVLSSHDALMDLVSKYPEARAKAKVLQFVSGLGLGKEHRSKADLSTDFNLRGDWFHIPNQLWKHKNHRIVIEALSILRQRDRLEPLVVSTGATEDFRHPRLLDELKAFAIELGVDHNFRFLGLVPYGDVTSLMYHATAVINPSLFEGWSTTVEEAKSTGKRVLLSDIPVHREQAPQRATFFAPGDPVALADAIKQAMKEHQPAIEHRAALEATAALPSRVLRFAETYQAIVLETFGS